MRRRGFTIVEVSILFVIFLIVAFLVAPLSLDDTRQAKITSRWRVVQDDFMNIFYSVNSHQKDSNSTFEKALNTILENEVKGEVPAYKITYLNGTFPSNTYRFSDYKQTISNAVLAVKLFEEPQGDLQGILMYDINGKSAPNTWGKDVYGLNIYSDRFEPFCKSESLASQKQDCSRNGTGLCCSNYYLIGGSFD